MTESVEELVAEYIELRESGEVIRPEEFANRYPAQSKKILAALHEVQKAEHLLLDRNLPSERFGPYRLIELIGSGGMGRVYCAAHDERPEEKIALKLLSALMAGNEQARSRFGREARSLGRLVHPGVVKVLGHGLIEDIPYLAMEWIQGLTLAQVLDDARAGSHEEEGQAPSQALAGALGLELPGYYCVADLVAQLARAVAAVHSSGVLHRDIKPGNVILRGPCDPVLVDFGLAASDETISLTGTGDLLGTPRYMAPEQARGETMDARTDVHALGLLLYELLTLKSPRPGDEAMGVLHAAMNQAIPEARGTDPRIPTPLDRIVHRACAFRPAARYGTAAELALDLEAFVAQSTVAARSFNAWERLQDAWVLRRKTLLTAVAGLLLLGILPFLREKPPDLDQLIERATLAFAADDLASTAANAQQILTYDPEHSLGLFLRGLASGNLVEAVEATESPLVDFLMQGLVHSDGKVWPQAIIALEKAQDLEPGLDLPRVLLERTRKKMAEQAASISGIETAPALTELGELYNGMEKWVDAEQVLRRAVELDPDLRLAWRELCVSQYFQGRFDGALQSASRGGRKVGLSYANTILLREKHLASEHVRAVLEPILQADPTDDQACLMMGYTYDHEHRLDLARGCYERAANAHPHNQVILEALAYLRAGGKSATCEECAAWYRDHSVDLDYAEAQRLYIRLIQLNRGNSNRIYTFAVALKRLGSEAISAAQDVIQSLLNEEDVLADHVRKNRLLKALDSLEN